MQYRLAIAVNGHQIHLGFRDNNLIVRARLRETVLELIPREKFGNPEYFDLPASLVENCIHWLDLSTGIVEIRQQPNIWKSKRSNWRLDINTRQAYKRTNRRTALLVDPQSPLFVRVARMFDFFEDRSQLTLFQPAVESLRVELRRLNLSFSVNKRGLFESPQLHAEIDPNQDAGTWFGLNSKIILRGVAYHDSVTPHRESTPQCQRSILVSMGDISYKVCIRASNFLSRGIFVIREICEHALLRIVYIRFSPNFVPSLCSRSK